MIIRNQIIYIYKKVEKRKEEEEEDRENYLFSLWEILEVGPHWDMMSSQKEAKSPRDECL